MLSPGISNESTRPLPTLQNTLRNSLADSNLSKDEFNDLSSLISADRTMPGPEKEKLLAVLNQARQDSQGFLFFKGKISERELGKLQEMAEQLGSSPVANELRESLEEIATSNERERSSFRGPVHRETPFTPDAGPRFPDRTSQGPGRTSGQRPAEEPVQVADNRRPQRTRTDASPLSGNRRSGSPQFDRLYVSQNGNNMPSGGGDCGPAVAAMVLKHYGHIPQGTSNADAIRAVRREVGVTSPRDGAWAITEGEITNGIEGLSGGSVRETGKRNFSGGQGSALRAEVEAQLGRGALPIIELGSPYSSPGRHYMVALEVKSNGNIVVADPGGNRQWEITPDRLNQLMEKADRRGGSYVMSYSES